MTTIETARLLLRAWKEEDLDAFGVMNVSKEVCEFLPKILSQQESDALAKRFIEHFQKHGFGPYAIEEKTSSSFIGFTGFYTPQFDAPFMPAIEIGWRLSPTHWGKGYATEAAIAVRDYGFQTLSFSEFVSFTVPHNIRSRRVMEKIGMSHNSADDFRHPDLPEDHPLSAHVLYRIQTNNPVRTS